MKKYILVLILAVSCSFSQWNTSTWDDVLPFDRSMIIKGDTIILAGYSGNLSVSTDFGITYSDRSFQENNFYISNIFLLDTTLIINSSFDEGMFYYSNDLGISWDKSQIDFDFFYSANKIINFKNRLYAINHKYLYSSDDNGKTWNLIKVVENDVFNDIYVYQNKLILFGYKNAYMYNELDENWNLLDINFPNNGYFENINIFNDIIFVAITNGYPDYLYYTTNLGETWIECNSEPLTSEKYNLIGFQNKYYISNNENLFVSNDTCKSWEVINTPFPLHKTIYFVNYNDKLYSVVGNEVYAFDGNEWSKWYGKDNYGNPLQLKLFDDYLYAASYSKPGYSSFNERLFSSSDNGKTWEPAIIGLDSIKEYKFIGDMIVAAYNDYDYLISTDKGSTWKELGIDNASFRDIRAYEKNIIVTNNLRYIYRSTDNGESWTNIIEELPFQITKKHNIEMFDNKLLLEHNGSLYYSEDLGDSWNDISDGLSEIPHNPDMYIDDLLIIISFDNEIYISYDNGDSWTVSSDNLPDDFFIIGVKKYDDKLFIPLMEIYSTHYKTNLYYSQNNGLSWTNITKDYINKLSINDFEYNNGTIIIGNSIDWRSFDYIGNIIYADLNIVSVENSDESTDYITVYPNPASDYIEITINKPSEGLEPSKGSEITIYDVLGNVVVNSVPSKSTSVPSGHLRQRRTQKIDISHLPSGVYFVRVGDRVEKFVKK